jgi:hypothetical protein
MGPGLVPLFTVSIVVANLAKLRRMRIFLLFSSHCGVEEISQGGRIHGFQ